MSNQKELLDYIWSMTGYMVGYKPEHMGYGYQLDPNGKVVFDGKPYASIEEAREHNPNNDEIFVAFEQLKGLLERR